MTLSRTEVRALVFKAACGGGLPLGYAEDLAAATEYLDMALITRCPCKGAAEAVPVALDLAIAGEEPQTVQAEPALIAAYVAATEAACRRRVVVEYSAEGAVLHGFGTEAAPPQRTAPRSRLAQALMAHLQDMAARTLVPDTAASRQAGAGAGLTDND